MTLQRYIEILGCVAAAMEGQGDGIPGTLSCTSGTEAQLRNFIYRQTQKEGKAQFLEPITEAELTDVFSMPVHSLYSCKWPPVDAGLHGEDTLPQAKLDEIGQTLKEHAK